MPGSIYLADSNILIRLVKRDHPEYPLARGAVGALWEKGVKLGYTLQNMAEFWNASTRPRERNGFLFDHRGDRRECPRDRARICFSGRQRSRLSGMAKNRRAAQSLRRAGARWTAGGGDAC